MTSKPRKLSVKASSSLASTWTARTRPPSNSEANACARCKSASAITISSKSLVWARSRVASEPIAPQPPSTMIRIVFFVGRTCVSDPGVGAHTGAPLQNNFPERPFNNLQTLIKFIVSNHQRHQRTNDIAKGARSDCNQTILQSELRESLSQFLRRLFCLSVLNKLQSAHRAQATHVANYRKAVLKFTESVDHFLANLFCAAAQMFTFDLFEHCERGAAGEWIAAKRAAQTADHRLIHDLGATGDRRDRQTGAERLRGDQNVRLDPKLLASKQGPGSAQTSLYFI